MKNGRFPVLCLKSGHRGLSIKRRPGPSCPEDGHDLPDICLDLNAEMRGKNADNEGKRGRACEVSGFILQHQADDGGLAQEADAQKAAVQSHGERGHRGLREHHAIPRRQGGGDAGASLAPPFRDFLCGFFTEAMAGTLIEWVEHRRTAQTPQQTVEYLLLVFRSSILNILNDAQAFGLSSALSGEKK